MTRSADSGHESVESVSESADSELILQIVQTVTRFYVRSFV